MRKIKNTFSLVIMVMTLLMLTSIPVLAESSNYIDSILIEVNEQTVVKVSLSEYSKADFLQDNSSLFCYLKGENDYMKIHSIYSSNLDKYISLSQFSKQMFLNEDNVSIAIENSTALPLETVKTFQEFKGFDGNGDPILEPVIPEEPTEPTAKLTITPDPILKDGFKLANVKANILGVENADKYAIEYSVKDANDVKHYVTTQKAKLNEINPDLIQYIEGETDLKVLIYDANNKLIEVEGLKIEIN